MGGGASKGATHQVYVEKQVAENVASAGEAQLRKKTLQEVADKSLLFDAHLQFHAGREIDVALLVLLNRLRLEVCIRCIRDTNAPLAKRESDKRELGGGEVRFGGRHVHVSVMRPARIALKPA